MRAIPKLTQSVSAKARVPAAMPQAEIVMSPKLNSTDLMAAMLPSADAIALSIVIA